MIIFDRSVARSLPRSLDRSIVRSLHRSIARSTARSIARSVDRSLVRSLARSIARSRDRSIDRSLDRSIALVQCGPVQSGFYFFRSGSGFILFRSGFANLVRVSKSGFQLSDPGSGTPRKNGHRMHRAGLRPRQYFWCELCSA